jgi:hypothetical protein
MLEDIKGGKRDNSRKAKSDQKYPCRKPQLYTDKRVKIIE